MSKESRPTKLAKTAAAAALSSLLALGVSGCSKGHYVKCYDVSKSGHWIGMPHGECKKLAGSKAIPMTNSETAKVKKYSDNDYVKCYGIAAASMNDCGTKSTACGGTVHTARVKDAWIAIPEGICNQVKGGIVVKPKKS